MAALLRHSLWPLAGLLLLFAVLLVPLPAWTTRMGSELENASHAPLFAAVAWSAWFWLRRNDPAGPDRYARHAQAWLIALLLALATEAAQPLTGRDDSWHDIYTDVLGATAALAALAAWGVARRRWQRVALILLATLAAIAALWPVAYAALAYEQRNAIAPRLLAPDSAMGRYFLQRRAIRITRAEGGGWLVTPARSQWPGLTIDEVVPDWTRYSALVIELRNPGTQPVTLLLRIDDAVASRRYADRYNGSFTLPAGARTTWRVATESLRHRSAGRALDLAHMRRVILFQDIADSTRPYVLHDIRLEP